MATILTHVDTSTVSMTGTNPVGNHISIPANTLAVNDDIEIWGGLFRSTGTDLPELQVYFAGTNIVSRYPVVAADVVLSYRVKVVVTATGSSGRILTISLANSDSGGSHMSIEDYTVDMTGAIAVSSNLIGTLSGKWTADRLVTKVLRS